MPALWPGMAAAGRQVGRHTARLGAKQVASFPHGRLLSTSPVSASPVAKNAQLPPAPPARWLSDLRARIGKCIMFGCSPPQVAEVSGVARALAEEWRRLTAGSEGFLTGDRRGLEDQKVVWGEMDSFGHVNNIMYNRYAETARVNWVHHIALRVDPAQGPQWLELMSTKSVGLILRSITTEYKFPMTFPDTISVYTKLRVSPAASDTPPTSLFLDCMILSHLEKRIAARTFEDIALYDYRVAARAQLPQFMQGVLEELWVQQAEETAKCRTRIWELITAVEKLERETWNRADAVEDMGSAKP